MAETPKRLANLLKVYVRDCSVESPNTPEIFRASGETQFKLDVDVAHRQIDGGLYEVTLTMSAKVTAAEKTMFLVEVHQAGLLQVAGYEGDELEQLLGAWVPGQIYPYAREVISSLSMHAGFPQVLLPLVNFETFYQQSREARLKAAQPAPPTGSAH